MELISRKVFVKDLLTITPTLDFVNLFDLSTERATRFRIDGGATGCGTVHS